MIEKPGMPSGRLYRRLGGRKAWKSLKVHCAASPGQEFGFTVYFLSGWAFVSQVHAGL